MTELAEMTPEQLRAEVARLSQALERVLNEASPNESLAQANFRLGRITQLAQQALHPHRFDDDD